MLHVASVQSVGLFICTGLTGSIACCLSGHLENVSTSSGEVDCCAVWGRAHPGPLWKCSNALVRGPACMCNTVLAAFQSFCIRDGF